MSHDKFAKGHEGGAGGCYTCVNCGKKTRETGRGESDRKMCVDCDYAKDTARGIVDDFYTIEDIPEDMRELVSKFLEAVSKMKETK